MKPPVPSIVADVSNEQVLSRNHKSLVRAGELPMSRCFVGRAFRDFCVPVKPGRPDNTGRRGAPNQCADPPAASIEEVR
jgi:hypothetical protein